MKQDTPLSIRSDNGSITSGEFVSRSGGWVSYRDHNGNIRKVRAGQVTEVKAPKPSGVTPMQTQETTTVDQTKVAVVADGEKSTVENLKEARSHYHKEKIGSGKDARILVDCDDEIAKTLRGADLPTVYSVAADKSGKTVADLQAKYGHLNPGMQRMNLGNIIRGALRPKPDNSVKEAEKVAAKAAREQAKVDAKAKREQEKADAKVKRDADAAEKKAAREQVAAEKKAEKDKAKAEAIAAVAAKKASGPETGGAA